MTDKPLFEATIEVDGKVVKTFESDDVDQGMAMLLLNSAEKYAKQYLDRGEHVPYDLLEKMMRHKRTLKIEP